MELGIYEQIINRFFKRKLDEMDQCKYYIGKKPIDKSNIAEYLSQYLHALIKQLFNQLGDDDRDLRRVLTLPTPSSSSYPLISVLKMTIS